MAVIVSTEAVSFSVPDDWIDFEPPEGTALVRVAAEGAAFRANVTVVIRAVDGPPHPLAAVDALLAGLVEPVLVDLELDGEGWPLVVTVVHDVADQTVVAYQRLDLVPGSLAVTTVTVPANQVPALSATATAILASVRPGR